MYQKQWTQFETQSLAFGLLRKALYPTYLVRGDLDGITIYKPTPDANNPTKILFIRVIDSDSKEQSGFFDQGDSNYLMVGGDQAYKAISLITPLLK